MMEKNAMKGLLVSAIVAAIMLGIGFWVSGGFAAEVCTTIAEDKAAVEAKGMEWLGVFDIPWTEDSAFVYYRGPDGMTYVSRVVGGCVERAGTR